MNHVLDFIKPLKNPENNIKSPIFAYFAKETELPKRPKKAMLRSQFVSLVHKSHKMIP